MRRFYRFIWLKLPNKAFINFLDWPRELNIAPYISIRWLQDWRFALKIEIIEVYFFFLKPGTTGLGIYETNCLKITRSVRKSTSCSFAEKPWEHILDLKLGKKWKTFSLSRFLSKFKISQKIKILIKSFKNFPKKIVISHFVKNWILYIFKKISKF